jgi:hypothetical protein
MDRTAYERDLIIVLCERLAGASGSNAVGDWEEDGGDRFLWRRDEGMVAIESRDKDGQPPYRLSVYRGDGALVDEVSSLLLENDRPAPWNAALATLYRAARRNALRADELLDTLISLLPAERPVDDATPAQ